MSLIDLDCEHHDGKDAVNVSLLLERIRNPQCDDKVINTYIVARAEGGVLGYIFSKRRRGHTYWCSLLSPQDLERNLRFNHSSRQKALQALLTL